MLEQLKKIYYPSDQAGFPMAIAVAALKYKKPFGYYMDRIHTVKDTVMDEGNIEYLLHLQNNSQGIAEHVDPAAIVEEAHKTLT